MSEPEFKPWPKTPRYFRNITITEKIDGTNAAINIVQFQTVDEWVRPIASGVVLGKRVQADNEFYGVYAQSRTRFVVPTADNYGFADWVWTHARTLISDLGPGLHYGEWWGKGIQRNYGLDERRLSLFNTAKWGEAEFVTPQLGTVPVLDEEVHDTAAVDEALAELKLCGSQAAPGFMKPEGVVIYHAASRTLFKATLDGDGAKGSAS